jgi:hypothetical protein
MWESDEGKGFEGSLVPLVRTYTPHVHPSPPLSLSLSVSPFVSLIVSVVCYSLLCSFLAKRELFFSLFPFKNKKKTINKKKDFTFLF